LVQNDTVLALPVPTITPAGPTTFCGASGGSVRLDATPGFAGYQWRVGGVDIPGATSASYTASVTGSYTVRVTDSDGCQGESRAVAVDADSCSGSCATLTCSGIAVVPNPGCPGVQQQFSAAYSGGEGVVTVQWDLDGDTVLETTGNPVTATHVPG